MARAAFWRPHPIHALSCGRGAPPRDKISGAARQRPVNNNYLCVLTGHAPVKTLFLSFFLSIFLSPSEPRGQRAQRRFFFLCSLASFVRLPLFYLCSPLLFCLPSFANLPSLACTTYLAPAAWALSLGGTSNLPSCSHRLAYRTFQCCALLPSDFTALCMCSFLLTSFANF